MWLLRLREPTPEKIAAFVTENPIEKMSGDNRVQMISEVARRVNKLGHEQRRELNESRRLEAFWRALNNEEKIRYSDLVTPQGFKVFFDAFNKMEPEKRRRMVEKAARNFREGGGEGIPEDVDPALVKRVVDQGLKAFYSEASIEAKMDAMPFLEELEKTFRWSR